MRKGGALMSQRTAFVLVVSTAVVLFSHTGFAQGTGNDRCVSGYFTRFVELSDAWNYSPDAPQLGASILRLIR